MRHQSSERSTDKRPMGDASWLPQRPLLLAPGEGGRPPLLAAPSRRCGPSKRQRAAGSFGPTTALSPPPSPLDPAAALGTSPGLCKKEKTGADHNQSLNGSCFCRMTLDLCAETLAERPWSANTPTTITTANRTRKSSRELFPIGPPMLCLRGFK